MFGFIRRIRDWVIAPALANTQAQTQAIHEAVNTRFDQLAAQDRLHETRLAAQLEQQDVQAAAKFEEQNIRLSQALSAQQSALAQQISDIALTEAMSLKMAGLIARSARLRAEADMPIPTFAPARPHSFEETLHRLEALNPALFPVWRELFDNGAKSYVEERLGSCSHREHKYAQLFAAYLEIYGHGRILDIGCGPYGLPSYLATRKPGLISGVEPLPLMEPASFEVVRGFNEFLPWDDGQFDVVVSGTSLDHVMSLETSLQEVRRVLRTGGRYIIWLASIPGAAPFDEKARRFKPIDRFHLFHFDRAWIEPLFERYFDIDDITVISQPGFDHVFYCMTPRAS